MHPSPLANRSPSLSAQVLVIGGGPAAIQASRLLKSRRPGLDVLVLRPEPHSLVYCAIPYAMEGLFPLTRTFKSDGLLTEVGVRLLRRRATAVDADVRRVQLDDGRAVSYERLLVVTGARPARPPVPGVDLANVYTLKTAEDTERILLRLGMGAGCADDGETPPVEGERVAVVVGAGAIGLEQAIAYRKRGIQVHLVDMRDHVLPHLVDADMTEDLHESLREMGIQLHLGAGLKALEGQKEVEQVVLADDTRISLEPGRDLVLLAVGMVPEIEFLESEVFERTADGLVVDEHMRTGVPGVWAAGDCTAGWSGIDGEPLGGKLATNAVPMAKVAALDILGETARYPGFYNGAVTTVGSWRVGGTGFTETYAPTRGRHVFATTGRTTTRFPMMPGGGPVTVKLVVDREDLRLVGAQVVGTEAVAERIDLLTLAIQQGLTAHDLAKLSYSAQPWQTFFPARNAIVDAATEAVRQERP